MKSISSLFLVLLLCIVITPAFAQWVRQYPLDKLEPVHSISLHSDHYGFAAGNNDLLLRLDNSTNSWTPLDNWDKGWQFKAVDYLEGTSGNFVAAGGNGMIVSTNAGNTWTEIAGAPFGIHALKIVSASEILVSSNVGVYLWENNAWTNLNLPVAINVLGGFILDRNHIWAFTNEGSATTYYTSNGGTNWASNTDIVSPDIMRFYNAQYGVATDGRKVFKTLNGGQLWTLVSTNELPNTVNDMTFGSSPGVLIGATFNAKPAISQDTGKTWISQTTGQIYNRNYSVAAKSDTEIWMGNDLTGIMHTTDGGVLWEETCGPTRNVIQDVHFINRQTGYACGPKGLLLRTADGGTTWEDISFGTRSYLAIDGLSSNDLWIGSNQRIYHSADNGTNWTEKFITTGANINDVLAIDATHILAASSTGTILLSTDSGTTWDTTYTDPSGQQLRSVSKIDNQRYMATGFNGVIVRSDDQGVTWHSVTIPEAGLQYEQSFFLGNDGWLVTSSFKKTMWHTTNAGNSWDAIDLPIDRFWDGVYFISPDTGIISCHSSSEGRAYITFNGGQNWQSGYITPFPLGGVAGVPNPNGTAWIFGYGSDIEVLPYCNALPVISDFVGDVNPCQLDTVTYSISSENIDQYHWQFPGGWTILGDANQPTVDVIVGQSSGNITIVGTNTCGFSSPITNFASAKLYPALGSVTGDDSPCEGMIVTYTIDHSRVDDYTWSLPDGWIFMSDPNQPTIEVQVGETPGVISVIGSNTCFAVGPETLNVTPTLSPILHGITGDVEACSRSMATYIADVEYEDDIIWTLPSDWDVQGPSNEAVIQVWVGDESGTIAAVAVNGCGMSSVQEINVMSLYVPLVGIVPPSDNVLSLNLTGIAYQWYKDGVPIPGATGATYTVTASGEYYATVLIDNGCYATSFPVHVIISATADAKAILPLRIFPNPVNDQFTIDGIENEYTYSILDFTGHALIRNVTSENNISVATLSEGIYVIRIEQEGKVYVTRFVVLRR